MLLPTPEQKCASQLLLNAKKSGQYKWKNMFKTGNYLYSPILHTMGCHHTNHTMREQNKLKKNQHHNVDTNSNRSVSNECLYTNWNKQYQF
jgi:hypothetical protein